MFTAEITKTDPQTVAYITMHGPYSQTPEGYGMLYGWVAQHGLTPTGMPAAVYLTMPGVDQSQADAIWELWAPVVGDLTELAPDETGIGIKRIGSLTVASTMHRGPYESVGPTYETLFTWIAGNGYRPDGPPAEFYYSDPDETPPEEYLTEVRIPVARV